MEDIGSVSLIADLGGPHQLEPFTT